MVTETVKIEGLLTADGIRFLFTSFVPNFMGFTAMGIILIVMIGVGVSERSGLIASLIRKLVASSPAGALTYIIVFLGDHLEHRLGRRLPGADPAGRRRLRQRRAASTGRDGRGVRRRRRWVRREPAS